MSTASLAAAEWLAAVPIDTSSTLFFIGADDASLRNALDRRGWRGRIVHVAPPQFGGLDDLARTLAPDSENPVVVLQPGVAGASRDAVREAARRIAREWFGARANQEAKRQNGGRYVINTLRNLDAIAREGDAAALAGLLPDVPAVVVGAGPSLDHNLADLARYRDRVCLICADTALRPLLAAGIEPDVVVVADPTETNARHLNDLPPCPQTVLVAEGSIDPEGLHHFAGRTFFYRVGEHHPWPWLGEAGLRRGALRSWGSVLTTAFDLALMMKCHSIVFAGADLAFTDGRPYARGTTFEEVWRRAEAWGQSIESCWSAGIAGWPETNVEDVHGQQVRTAPHLRSFRDWIAAEAAKTTDRNIVNGTGGGILVGPGIVQASLAATLSQLPPLTTRVSARILGAHAVSGSIGRPLAVEPVTLARWQEFAGNGLDEVEVMRALGYAVPNTAISRPEPSPLASALSNPSEVTLECVPEDRELLATIEDAWQRRGDADRLVLQDRTGAVAGASVRRALFAFLERHPELRGRYGRFFDPFSDTSWIDQRSAQELSPGLDLDKFLPHHEATAARLAALLVERYRPVSVLDVGCGAGYWMRALQALGVQQVSGADDRRLFEAANVAVPTGVTATDWTTFEPSRSVDLCLCLGVVQRTAAAAADALVAACTRASDTVIFSVPSAGIGAAGYLNERPSSAWHQRFLDHGFAPCDELRPLVEERWGQYQSAYDLLKVYRRVVAPGDSIRAVTRRALLEAACRIDDLVLQTHWHNAARAAQALRAPRLPELRFDRLAMPAARMEAGANGARLFRFRTAAAALCLAIDATPVVVEEDGAPLERVAAVDQLQAGTYVIEGDTIAFMSRAGLDPRHNGRCYTASVPSYVAWLERQPLLDIVGQRL